MYLEGDVNKKLKLALMDMYKGEKNLGMQGLRDLIDRYTDFIDYQEFDVRSKNEVPDDSFDIYISTGGPGSPKRGDGPWEKDYYRLIDRLWDLDQNGVKKYVLLICHSFQMVSSHFKIGKIRKRRNPSVGVFPVHKTEDGLGDKLFASLPDPFYVVDSREYQIIHPDYERVTEVGAQLLLLEKERPHVDLPRAIMAKRICEEWVGVQFHPEAEPSVLIPHFNKPEVREKFVEKYGEKRYNKLIKELKKPERIQLTFDTVIPGFLEEAIKGLGGGEVNMRLSGKQRVEA